MWCYWSGRVGKITGKNMSPFPVHHHLCWRGEKDRDRERRESPALGQPCCCNRKWGPWLTWHDVENNQHAQAWHRLLDSVRGYELQQYVSLGLAQWRVVCQCQTPRADLNTSYLKTKLGIKTKKRTLTQRARYHTSVLFWYGPKCACIINPKSFKSQREISSQISESNLMQSSKSDFLK